MKPAVAAGDLNPSSIVLLAGCPFAGATELFLAADTPLAEFRLALGVTADEQPIGYARFERRGEEPTSSGSQGRFELVELLSAHSPTPHPTVSLSGVLWTRREALSVDAAIQSFLRQEDPTPGYAQQ